MRKRGNAVLDSVLVLAVLAGFGIMAVMFTQVLDEFNTDVQSSDLDAEAKTFSNNVNTNFPTWMDYAFLLIVVLVWAGMLILSFFLDTHPVFFILMGILLIVVVFAASAMQDLYVEISGDADFSSFAAQLPITDFILSHFLIIMMVDAVSVIITLYAKQRQGGGF